MVGVFAIFGALQAMIFKQFGVGLAAAILIDATIVRAILLPASMKLLGEWNWYLPTLAELAPPPRARRLVDPHLDDEPPVPPGTLTRPRTPYKEPPDDPPAHQLRRRAARRRPTPHRSPPQHLAHVPTLPRTSFDVAWAPCDKAPKAQCGILEVPLDWSAPEGATIDRGGGSASRRRPSPADRHAVLQPRRARRRCSPLHRGRRADLLEHAARPLRHRRHGPARDRRQRPVTCAVPVLAPELTPVPRTERSSGSSRQHNRAVGQSCLQATGALIGHVDTISVARDHEALRQALGVRQVSWLGLSYGTQVAANYAELFPAHTRAMVLDAALEHSLTEIEQVADETMAAEDSLQPVPALVRTAPACALQGRDVGRLFDRLVARADRHPIPVEGALRPVTGEDIRMGTIGLLLFKEPIASRPDDVLGGAVPGRSGRPCAATPPRSPSRPRRSPRTTSRTSSASAASSTCLRCTTYGEMRQRMQMGRQLAPHLQGASEIWQANLCIGWPDPGREPATAPARRGRTHADRARRPRPLGRLQVGARPGRPDPRQRHAHPHRRRAHLLLHLAVRANRHGPLPDPAGGTGGQRLPRLTDENTSHPASTSRTDPARLRCGRRRPTTAAFGNGVLRVPWILATCRPRGFVASDARSASAQGHRLPEGEATTLEGME